MKPSKQALATLIGALLAAGPLPASAGDVPVEAVSMVSEKLLSDKAAPAGKGAPGAAAKHKAAPATPPTVRF